MKIYGDESLLVIIIWTELGLYLRFDFHNLFLNSQMIMKLKLINVKYYDCESLCESLILYNRIVKFLNASTNRELLFCLNEKKKKEKLHISVSFSFQMNVILRNVGINNFYQRLNRTYFSNQSPLLLRNNGEKWLFENR